MIDAKPMTDAEIQHLVKVLEDIDKPFGHFNVTRKEFLRDAHAVHVRAEEEQANFTILNDKGKPSAYVSVNQREWPMWEVDGPRLLATAIALQSRVSELEDSILVSEADDAIARSFGRNANACTVADEIRSRRGHGWRGAIVDGPERI